ncbi:HK97-gp10 family putative phage morphogenesis protein [Paracoccus sp. (in: a-proteobacteria)]|uniref:HK97-gp10 family putative phage morphogenesis protein n=1 Tax=Paracoccus sp. TaxID=267 RepID=UPI002AFDE672|nr:HK97-gp10 family putative phage morphogenesis protein [Paracoccus sp. (in: a-proteobacteria)]
MVKGLDEVQADLIRRLYNVRLAAKQEARTQGEGVAAAARYLAPRDDGDLIRSIRVEDVDSVTTSKGGRDFIGVAIKAGDEKTVVTNSSGGRFQNARIQEFGTKSRAANPFFFPAWKANRRRVRSAISRAVRKAWTS